MALRDTLSFQHLMRFRRRSATSVVDASENYYRLRSCAHRTRITLLDRWQRSRNGLTRHVEPPTFNAFPPPLSNKRCGCLREFLLTALVRPQTRITLPNRWQRSRNGLTRQVEPPAPNAFPPPLSNKRCGCLREFFYPALVRPKNSHHPSRPLAAKSQWPYATRGASST